jgi:hypothetical protein
MDVLNTLFYLGPEPTYPFDNQPPQCAFGLNISAATASLVVERNFSATAIAKAVSAVVTPRVLCFPFEENPPYFCTGKQRASSLTIVVESLSFYGSVSWALTTGLVSALQLREYLRKKK